MHPMRNTFPVFKAQRWDNLEQNEETINTFNPEYLPVLRLYAGTIRVSNLEHLLVFKAPRGDDPAQNE